MVDFTFSQGATDKQIFSKKLLFSVVLTIEAPLLFES